MRTSTCKNCTERKELCHSNCEKYREYRNAIEKISEIRRKKGELNEYCKITSRRMMAKMRKK